MALSEQEQRMLDEIESALYADDPKFSSAMLSQFDGESASSKGGRGFTGPVLGAIALGLVLLVAGMAGAVVSKWLLSVSVLGFILMFGAGVWALTGSSNSALRSTSSSASSSKKVFGRGSKNSEQRKVGGTGSLESRFRNRFEGH